MGPSVKMEPNPDPVVVPKLASGQLNLVIDLTQDPECFLGFCVFTFFILGFHFRLGRASDTPEMPLVSEIVSPLVPKSPVKFSQVPVVAVPVETATTSTQTL